MKQQKPAFERGRSHLFTVRVWPEALDNGRTEWRGQVTRVLSGETHAFRDLEMLVALLSAMLPEQDDGAAPAATDPRFGAS